MKEFERCRLCPRECLVNRNNNELGFCNAGNKITIGKYYLHKWEEPCISGNKGSGTIFFTYCNLRCLFCQNYKISADNYGVEISIERFSEICLELEKMGANNINLVTPTHFVPLIIEGIKLARENGLHIPIVYNSSGYESVDTIKMLENTVDIYLPDFKYYSDELAFKYSKCHNYFKYASKALEEMVRQKVRCKFDKNGNMISGVIVRHLIIPSEEEDSKKVLTYLYSKFKNKIFYSIMNQYTPIKKCKYDNLNETLSDRVYDDIIDYAWNIGIRNAFIQDGGSVGESFIPDFDFKG